jgi:hypothetical protein
LDVLCALYSERASQSKGRAQPHRDLAVSTQHNTMH